MRHLLRVLVSACVQGVLVLAGAVSVSAQTGPTPNLVASVAPAVVNVGDTVLITLQAAPGYPAITMAVPEVNLREIGGGNSDHGLYDLGEFGDAVAGDHIYSLRIPVRYPTFEGVKRLRIVNSGPAAGIAEVDLTVIAPPAPPSALGTVSGLAGLPNFAVRGAATRVEVTVTPGSGPISTGLAVTLDLSALGLSSTAALSDDGGFACDRTAGDRIFTACFVTPREVATRAPFGMTGVVTDAQGRRAMVEVVVSIIEGDADSDADGLPDACEQTFALTAVDTAAGDPDGDGVSTLAECQALTHPRGLFTRHFAEGAANAFFHTRLSLFNPSATAATALVTSAREQGSARRVSVAVPARSVVNLVPADTQILGEGPFSTRIESDVELIADRTMTFAGDEEGSHAETAVRALSSTARFAEGATSWRFSLFYLVFNPGTQPAQTTARFETSQGQVYTASYLVQPLQRLTIPVDDLELPAGSGNHPLREAEVAATFTTVGDVPIVVERSLYLSPDGHPFGAGSVAAGVPAGSTRWIFAEGATGAFFDEFLLLSNSSASPCAVTIVFTPEGGAPITRQYTVAPSSRATIYVDAIPGLEATSVSALITADQPLVAERAMWWPGSGESWRESHATFGATAGAPRWAIAGLEVGGDHDAHSYILVSGGGTVTIHPQGGVPATCGTSSGGRFTLHVNDCPGIHFRYAAAIVEGNADTVVEWATYRGANGEPFAAGAAALAVPIP